MTTTRQPRPSALGKDLVPTVSIDPGSASTGVVLRVGPAPAAFVVLNPERTDQKHAPGADPAVGYAKAVQVAVSTAADQHADIARAWYGIGLVPPEVDPWLYAIEKINPARTPQTDHERSHFDPVAIADGSTFAANAVFNRLLGAFDGKVVWVIPFHADTRWESRFEQWTGDPRDYYPAALLAPVIPTDARARSFGRGFLDSREHQSTRVKDVCAAWSIGCDAAEDYERNCLRIYGRVLPPHQAPTAIARTNPAARFPVSEPVSVRCWDLSSQEDPPRRSGSTVPEPDSPDTSRVIPRAPTQSPATCSPSPTTRGHRLLRFSLCGANG